MDFYIVEGIVYTYVLNINAYANSVIEHWQSYFQLSFFVSFKNIPGKDRYNSACYDTINLQQDVFESDELRSAIFIHTFCTHNSFFIDLDIFR